jgi:PIN domain nuclease of toxin-antitoxin system
LREADVKLLLDTNILIFSAKDDLGDKALRMINDVDNRLYYSVAALWEMAIKCESGKLKLPIPLWALEQELNSNGYQVREINAKHVNALAGLKAIHRDPFDRIMIAQAIVDEMAFLTTDELLLGYSPRVLLV